MPRKPKIRWRQGNTINDVKEIEKVINNFNAKLYRIEKKDPSMAKYLPPRLKKRDVMNMIETRADFNTFVDIHKSFSRRGAEELVQGEGNRRFIKWAYNLHETAKEKVNSEREKRKKELLNKPVLSRGKEVGYTLGEVYSGKAGMHDIAEVKLNPVTRKPDSMSQEEFKKSFMGLERQLYASNMRDKQELFKQNYVKAMANEGYSQQMRDFINTVPADIMGDTVLIDSEAEIGFVYDAAELRAKEEALRQVWGSALERANYSQTEWASIINDSDASDYSISVYMNYVGVQSGKQPNWKKIFKKAGFSQERINNLLGG